MDGHPEVGVHIQVACYSGYRGEETPRLIRFASRTVTVKKVVDRWLAPDHRYFKILGEDGAIYIIRHETATWQWELTYYEQGGQMAEDRSTEILKNAILLEKRGYAFYAKVAEQATAEAVKRFFEMLAEEEAKHIQILSEQFKSYHEHQRFKPSEQVQNGSFETAGAILNDELKKQISAADYEAAAIAAAMAMEKNALEMYAGRAADAQDPNEKALYHWLADWETQHLESLSEINREITQEIWFDNTFWPF